jgi:lipase
VWAILPGLTMPPEDFADLAALLPGEVRVLDAYQVPLTAPTAQVRDWFQAQGGWSEVALIGHSAGGMAALEWWLTRPEEVSGVVLLDPTDPWEKVRKPLPGTLGHRAVRRLLQIAGSWTWLARRLGRLGRRTFWRLFTHDPDHLDRATVDRVWGNPAGLIAVWDQYFDRFRQEARVRQLLAAREQDGDRPAPPVLAVHSSQAEPYHVPLADRLGATVADLPGDHLFPTRQPAATAALIERWTTGA